MTSDVAILPEADERHEELLALARLLTYAKTTARLLEAEVAVFCIESAIGAVVEQISTTMEGNPGLTEIVDLRQPSRC